MSSFNLSLSKYWYPPKLIILSFDIFELKLFKHRKVDVEIFDQLLSNYQLVNFDKVVLITNVKIINDLKIKDKRIITIDRNELIQILKSNMRLDVKLNQ